MGVHERYSRMEGGCYTVCSERLILLELKTGVSRAGATYPLVEVRHRLVE